MTIIQNVPLIKFNLLLEKGYLDKHDKHEFLSLMTLSSMSTAELLTSKFHHRNIYKEIATNGGEN